MAAATKKESGQTPEPPTPTNARKAWTPKSPIDIMLDQIRKQEERVSRLQTEIDAEKLTLTKLRKAKEFLEA
jgi:hypothetical protein